MADDLQGELDIQVREKAPAVSPEDVRRLVSILRSSGSWMTRRELAVAFGGEEAADRKVRAIAEVAAPVVVSWPGSPGYRHWDACSVEEINHCIEAFESSGKKQFRRAHVYRLAYHRRFRAAASEPIEQMLGIG